MDFKEIRVELPTIDADVVIVFPGGKEMVVQARPSNAEENYNGSLDIILPEDQLVLVWKGDDMEPSEAPYPDSQESRIGKQFVTNLPGDYN